MASYLPTRPPDSLWANAQQQAASRGLPPLPDVQPAQGGGINFQSLFGPAASLASHFIPGAGIAKSLWDAGQGGFEGYTRARYGDTKTNYQMGDGTGSTNVEIDKPSTAASIFKWLNPARAAGYGIGYGAGSATAPTIEASPNLPQPSAQSLFEPIQSTRPLAPRTSDIEQSARTAAERSLFDAYGKGSKYDPTGRGWVEGPLTQSNPAPAASLFPSSPDMGGTFGNGTWSPWYASQPDPYSATGNMLDRVSAYDFGAGRYQDSPALASYWNPENSLLFGSMTRFGSGANNTD